MIALRPTTTVMQTVEHPDMGKAVGPGVLCERTCSEVGVPSLTRMCSPLARSSTSTGCARHAVPAPNTSSRRPSSAACGNAQHQMHKRHAVPLNSKQLAAC